MDYPFRLTPIFKSKEILRLTSEEYNSLPRDPVNIHSNVTSILDRAGKLSALAQKLPSVITTGSKFGACNHIIYIHHTTDPEMGKLVVSGFLKIGVKSLFLYDAANTIWEVAPMCILDFYVHERLQRMGIGRKLFDSALDDLGIAPHRLAYDRPSPKLIGFCAKHFGLTNYRPQNNSFVAFDEFFLPKSPVRLTKRDTFPDAPPTPTLAPTRAPVRTRPVVEQVRPTPAPSAPAPAATGNDTEAYEDQDALDGPGDLMEMQRQLNATTYDYMRRNTTLGRYL